MPYLLLENRQHPLLEGETRVGGGQTADVRLVAGPEGGSIDAVISVEPDHTASVRRLAANAAIEINGIPLGTQPTPLFHGDRLKINGHALVFGDEAQGGATRQVVVSDHDSPPPAAPRPGRRPRSGGRLVSLTDGREYTVRTDGLTLGREAGCDIVIAAAEVSRRHARIELRPDGYALLDMSTNGILVNGRRLKGSHALETGDTLRIGPDEFRFHSDAVTAAPAVRTPLPPPPLEPPPRGAAPPLPAMASSAGAAPGGVATPSAPATPRPAAAAAPVTPAAPGTGPTAAAPPIKPAEAATEPSAGPAAKPPAPAPTPAPGAAPARPALAVLEILNEGPAKGTRFDVVDVLTHVGRGAHNDIVIGDESVSDSHAKLQRRQPGWFVADLDSTNGTYVNGARVRSDARLPGGAELRFGGVKLRFEPVAAPADPAGGTRVIVKYRPPTPPDADAVPAAPGETVQEPDDEAPAPLPRALVAAVLLLAAAVVFLILRTLA